MKISAPSRKWICIFSILLAALAGILGWMLDVVFEPFAVHPPEPQYQGRKLTDWAKGLCFDNGFIKDIRPLIVRQKHELAVAAIRHMGTNALPVALELCETSDSWLKRKLEEATSYNSACIKRYVITTEWEKRETGDNIIRALGPAASPAIPALIHLLQSPDGSVIYDVSPDLLAVGTNAIPPLLKQLKGTNQAVRLRSAIILGNFFRPKMLTNGPSGFLLIPGSESFRSSARAAMPVLLAGMDNQKLYSTTRLQTVHALGLIHEDAPTVVPILIQHIQSEIIQTNAMPDWMTLSAYFRALGNFGTNAKPVVPFLINILKSNPNQPHSRDKEQALGNLLRIDPKIAQPFLEKWKNNYLP